MEVIQVEKLTKDYGDNRGIFDLNFAINKGETFGFVGTNGSGKTTTIRHIMGFLKPQKGKVLVMGMDAWKNSCEIKRYVEYVPGEIAFPDLKDGTTFLKNQAELLNLKDMSYATSLINRLQLDTSANLKRMSKGMKQKTAIVAALMADKDIIILDEPTTGLDPLMRETFIELILEEKKKGKTILMSSQMFGELEITCDRVALILNGRIVDIADINELKSLPYKSFKIEFNKEEEYKKFKKLKFNIIRDQVQYNQVTVKIEDKDINRLFKVLQNYDLKFISEVQYNLEKHFKDILFKMEEEKKNAELEMNKEEKSSNNEEILSQAENNDKLQTNIEQPCEDNVHNEDDKEEDKHEEIKEHKEKTDNEKEGSKKIGLENKKKKKGGKNV